MIRAIRINLLVAVLFSLLTIPPLVEASESNLPYRLVYAGHNLASDSELQNLLDVMRRAAAAGYNGIVLADWRIQTVEKVPDKYLKNITAVAAVATKLNLMIYPMMSAANQAQGILTHDPNLAEGMPVRSAPFLVKKGQADIIADPAVHLRGGDFEQSQGNKVAGWDIHDKPGQTTAVDRMVRHGGLQSLRLNNSGKPVFKGGSDSISQIIEVSPARQYHLSAWVKTENLSAVDKVRHAVLTPAGQPLSLTEWDIKRNQDWVQYHTVFNSQNQKRVRLEFRISPGKEGKVWIDDVQLEEVGLLNILRRNGCPLTVKGDDGYTYREGRDYDIIRDDKMSINGKLSSYHQAPVIKILPGSRICEGQVLRVSYYHAVAVGKGKQTACLSDEKVHSLLKKDIEDLDGRLKPAGIFLNYSDIRIANWCESCRAKNLTPGRLLADHIARSAQIVREVNPRMKVLVWSDMFDPYQNAIDHYYLVNGSLVGSWQGLSPEVIIVNVNQTAKYPDSLRWFDERMHSQIVSVCFDNGPQASRKRLEGMRSLPEPSGVMYLTANNRYEDLEHFARHAWGQGRDRLMTPEKGNQP
jgi:hypothetical protein